MVKIECCLYLVGIMMRENELVAIRNVQAYLEAIDKSHKWVCQRANILEEHFIKFLNGEWTFLQSYLTR